MHVIINFETFKWWVFNRFLFGFVSISLPTKYSYCVFAFSVGYSAVALNHVIDFKEKKQVIFVGVVCS